MGRSQDRKANKADPKHAVDESVASNPERLYTSSYADAQAFFNGTNAGNPLYDQVVFQLDFNPLTR